jgi:hypothetical protein
LCTAKVAQLLSLDGGFYAGAMDSDHLPHGAGTLFHKDGSERASGEWEHGQLFTGPKNELGRRHGHGKLIRCDGTEVSAVWTDGVATEGTIRLSMGSQYVGALQNALEHGEGCLSDATCNESYRGSWAAGKQEGLGLWNVSGRTYEGEFTAGRFNGFGITRSEEGEIMQCGLWKDDMLVKSCFVSIAKLPFKLFLIDAGKENIVCKTIVDCHFRVRE